MRISELSQRAMVPLSAVKYYQREGLLPEGVRSAPNQVEYEGLHVKRVRLIRALLETGGLSIAATKDVIRALDVEGAPLAETFSVAAHAMSTPRITESVPSAESRERVMRLAHSQDWKFTDDNPGIDSAARALDGLSAIDFNAPDEYLVAYAAAAAAAAAADLHALTALSDPDQIAELMVVGTVLGDPLFAGLRRLAHEDGTHYLFPTNPNRDQS
ncbi:MULTISPECIES: MerR family transcriptional regulator [Cryobacterium]|uniref:MerR family transcriptional regulator n=1 Tax=Cryobacterium breve TaxID=1259258 RepID=A0ABY2JAY9_9MICO|nr:MULTISPECIES: MerR family transcriptional regulator [Cryobacterium]TFC92929.1 MerR family transcriptional regulator [Cryobacterium sp. TmT3-12]TFD02108.1 MerR family transcriptional regulator [Cryobacterium breve]